MENHGEDQMQPNESCPAEIFLLDAEPEMLTDSRVKDHVTIESEDYKLHIFQCSVKHENLSRHYLKLFAFSDSSFIDAMNLKISGSLNFCNNAYTVSNITILSYNSSNEMFEKFTRYLQGKLSHH